MPDDFSAEHATSDTPYIPWWSDQPAPLVLPSIDVDPDRAEAASNDLRTVAPGGALTEVTLAELLTVSRDAARSLNHIRSWQAVTAFAYSWFDVPDTSEVDRLTVLADLPEALHGEYFALQHAVSDQLDLPNLAEYWLHQWRRWGENTNRHDVVLHARAFQAFAEVDSLVGIDAGRVVTNDDIPLLIDLVADILATTVTETTTEPLSETRYRYSLSAAVAGAAATLAGRQDLSEQLAQWSRRYAPSPHTRDDQRLMTAQLARLAGDNSRAARIANDVANAPAGDAVTTTIEARGFIATLSMLGDHDKEAIRQLRAITELGLVHHTVIGTARQMRNFLALLVANGHFEEAHQWVPKIVAAVKPLPDNPITLDVVLLEARLDWIEERFDRAYEKAIAVARKSARTDDVERSTVAYELAIAAAPSPAANALRRKLITALDAARDTQASLQQRGTLARELAHDDFVGALAVLDEAAPLLSDPWTRAGWHDDAAYVYWVAGDLDVAIDAARQAAELYQQSADPMQAARALVTVVQAYVDQGGAVAELGQ